MLLRFNNDIKIFFKHFIFHSYEHSGFLFKHFVVLGLYTSHYMLGFSGVSVEVRLQRDKCQLVQICFDEFKKVLLRVKA